ncbi:hypothetical protein Dsin_012026 [Dipteronia sinensis]|uniref:Uncharacterized protein n=1 Tax=Dipteronia sinensis TaxID=43782 RepID=A0AAE0AHG9_9ROSI|nr:hypothetical protein Dsin_012026 [Dipteronia sinensis]
MKLWTASSSIGQGLWQNISDIEGQLDFLLEIEERYWRQRSRAEWLWVGDKNTSFFHKKALARRVGIIMWGLFDVDGNWKKSNMDMEAVVIQYFSNLFDSSNPTQ